MIRKFKTNVTILLALIMCPFLAISEAGKTEYEAAMERFSEASPLPMSDFMNDRYLVGTCYWPHSSESIPTFAGFEGRNANDQVYFLSAPADGSYFAGMKDEITNAISEFIEKGKDKYGELRLSSSTLEQTTLSFPFSANTSYSGKSIVYSQSFACGVKNQFRTTTLEKSVVISVSSYDGINNCPTGIKVCVYPKEYIPSSKEVIDFIPDFESSVPLGNAEFSVVLKDEEVVIVMPQFGFGTFSDCEMEAAILKMQQIVEQNKALKSCLWGHEIGTGTSFCRSQSHEKFLELVLKIDPIARKSAAWKKFKNTF